MKYLIIACLITLCSCQFEETTTRKPWPGPFADHRIGEQPKDTPEVAAAKANLARTYQYFESILPPLPPEQRYIKPTERNIIQTNENFVPYNQQRSDIPRTQSVVRQPVENDGIIQTNEDYVQYNEQRSYIPQTKSIVHQPVQVNENFAELNQQRSYIPQAQIAVQTPQFQRNYDEEPAELQVSTPRPQLKWQQYPTLQNQPRSQNFGSWVPEAKTEHYTQPQSVNQNYGRWIPNVEVNGYVQPQNQPVSQNTGKWVPETRSEQYVQPSSQSVDQSSDRWIPQSIQTQPINQDFGRYINDDDNDDVYSKPVQAVERKVYAEDLPKAPTGETLDVYAARIAHLDAIEKARASLPVISEATPVPYTRQHF